MIERSSLRPYLFDNRRQIMLMADYEIRYETLNLGFTTGYTDKGCDVIASQNPVAPAVTAATIMYVWRRSKWPPVGDFALANRG